MRNDRNGYNRAECFGMPYPGTSVDRPQAVADARRSWNSGHSDPLSSGPTASQCELGPARVRSILAMLLLTPRTIVPAETLIDRLWDTRPPPKASESLSAYVARLRASLREVAGRRRAAGRARARLRAGRRSRARRRAPVPAAAPPGGRAGGQRRVRSRRRAAARGGRAVARPGAGRDRRRLGRADARRPRGGAPGGHPGARRVRARARPARRPGRRAPPPAGAVPAGRDVRRPPDDGPVLERPAR